MALTIKKYSTWIWCVAAAVVLALVAAVFSSVWMPVYRQLFAAQPLAAQSTLRQEGGHDHAASSDSHAGHSVSASITLSPQGLRNIDFQPLTISIGTYTRRVAIPAMVVERPGRTQTNISAPLTGVITKIYPVEGSSVAPGSPLFEIRLTHEELVTAQSNLIRTAEALNVVQKELARLSELDEGVVAGTRILEQQYEKQKLDASLLAERQTLLLHGLSEQQIENILRRKILLETLLVSAPCQANGDSGCGTSHSYHVQELSVRVGQQVQAGEILGVIADHCELYIVGSAFEDDATSLREAADQQRDISAALLVQGKGVDRINDLRVLYLADHVDPQSRAFRFFIALPNEIVSRRETANGQQFAEWRFKPGQRMELQVPVSEWRDEIVVPVEAIVQEGAEAYVYQQNGEHFDQVPVNVKYRDQMSAVIANDGSLFPGDQIAARGAYEMHLTLKNQSGGGVDPHAGHNH